MEILPPFYLDIFYAKKPLLSDTPAIFGSSLARLDFLVAKKPALNASLET